LYVVEVGRPSPLRRVAVVDREDDVAAAGEPSRKLRKVAWSAVPPRAAINLDDDRTHSPHRCLRSIHIDRERLAVGGGEHDAPRDADSADRNSSKKINEAQPTASKRRCDFAAERARRLIEAS